MEGTPAVIPRHRARGPNLSAALRSALTHTHAVRRFPLASGWDAGPSQLQPHSSRSGRNRALPVLLKKKYEANQCLFSSTGSNAAPESAAGSCRLLFFGLTLQDPARQF